ncbi:MAG: glycosyltransferase family A protein [Paludibacter sp.]|nr:glycosyltransferase family A protein [Paludibacter sp.]
MFTVIIPLYNKAAYVEKAIRSVLHQTYQEFELIVVDDGSTDDPLPPKGGSIAERLEDRSFTPHLGGWGGKVRVIKQQNQGVSVARNNGVKAAKYDYIAFLDADDWWEPTYLEEMKSLMDEFPEAGIYGSSYYKVKNGKLIPANIGVESDFERGCINYCKVYAKTMYMPLWTGATIISKSIFESEKGFKPTLKLGEDFDLWIRVAMKYPVAFLNKSLAYYNQDVELQHRAIGEKLYEPEQHMLFSDYGELNNNPDFRILYERLAVYGLLPYYLAGKNKKEVENILSGINWKNHAFKYRLYYTILPKGMVRMWMDFLKVGSILK